MPKIFRRQLGHLLRLMYRYVWIPMPTCNHFQGFPNEDIGRKQFLVAICALYRYNDFIVFNCNCAYLGSWFLLARRYASAGLCDSNVSVCLPVRPSVTSRYCVKTKKASVMVSSPSGSSMILVICCQISSQHSKGFPRSGGLKQWSGGKLQPFFYL